MAACERACPGPARDHAPDGQAPEGRELLLVGAGQAGEPREAVEDPQGDRDQVKDADELVDRGMDGPLLVAVVQAVELRGDDPQWQRRKEDPDFGAHADRVDLWGPSAEESLGREKGGQQADDIRRSKQPADEPTMTRAWR